MAASAKRGSDARAVVSEPADAAVEAMTKEGKTVRVIRARSGTDKTAVHSGEPPPSGPRCLVVMYHYVHDVSPGDGGSVSPTACGVRGLTISAFQRQLDTLCRHLEPVDWPTFYAWTRGRGSIPHRCFLLTFDDGLADHARVVAPTLTERGLHGVFFVPGAVLESHTMLPAHAIHALLSRLDEVTFEREVRQLVCDPGSTIPASLASAMYGYESEARSRLKYYLTVQLPFADRDRAIARLFERYVGSSARWAKRWYLGWDDLAEMQAAGHTIGGHGFRHEPNDRLTSRQRRLDMQQVASVLAEGLGADLRPFSYPYGAYNADTMAACVEAGFVHGFTTDCQWTAEPLDLLAIPRVDTIRVDAVLESDSACLPV